MPHRTHLQRRQIIKEFLLGTASSWLAGQSLTQRVLAANVPERPATGRLDLTVSDFPALDEVLGSVRLDVGLDKPIIINRSATGFHVLSSFCQHNGCTVDAFDPSLEVMRCACHGSRYNLDGSLNQGPALRGLARYEAVFDGNDTLRIELPGVNFTARQLTIVSTTVNARRLRLSFLARIFTSYQVLYRPTLGVPPQILAFALTPSGPAAQLTFRNAVFDPHDPLPEVEVFVDVSGPSGFFSISLLPMQV